jgi:truncated hemoglobin YjbI
MLMAMQDLGLDEEKQDVLLQAFFKTADWMRNQGS